ncbi:VOC family protein [Actinoplanes aureus]|uniref:VOC family protein n=1 Tax=Actinoplanes aureus TaxID=2792083 RepID=A0A931C9H5_9ACTN|nr:VOC family protein [Actinoplanes aureus]MBG0564634.1 VOC family protein [Actinoplanes aureus]
MSSFRDVSTILYVEDLDASLVFYRDLLGFAQTYQFPPDGTAVFVGLEHGISLAAVNDGELGSHGQPIRMRVGRPFELCVYTDDVDKALSTLRARQVPVLAEPADQPWGERMAYVADPDGNPVMICAPVASS